MQTFLLLTIGYGFLSVISTIFVISTLLISAQISHSEEKKLLAFAGTAEMRARTYKGDRNEL